MTSRRKDIRFCERSEAIPILEIATLLLELAMTGNDVFLTASSVSNGMKIAVLIFLSVLLILLVGEIRFFGQKNSENEARYQKVRAELNQAQMDLNKAQADLSYYLNPANLEKELKARFNYKMTGEKMFIIVQPVSSTEQ